MYPYHNMATSKIRKCYVAIQLHTLNLTTVLSLAQNFSSLTLFPSSSLKFENRLMTTFAALAQTSVSRPYYRITRVIHIPSILRTHKTASLCFRLVSLELY